VTENIRGGRLFLGSYALLFLLLAIRFQPPWLWIPCLAVAIIGLADTAWIVFVASGRTEPEPIRIKAVRDTGPEISGYLATYLLPFLTVSSPTARDLMAYAAFLFVAGLLYLKSEMAQINPALYLLGRRVLHISTDSGWDGYVVVRSSLIAPGTVLSAAPLNPTIRVEAVRREG
jgi:hypothetical protein